MSDVFRPATLGEILDRTASLYRSRFLVLFGIASVPSAILLGFMGCFVLLVAWVGKSSPEAGMLAGLIIGQLSLILLPLIVGAQSLSGAALCHAAGALVYGEKVTIRDVFRAAWRQGWRYVGLYLLLVLILFGIPVTAWTLLLGLFAIAAAAAGSGSAGVMLGILTVLLVLGIAVYVLWMLTRLCLAFPIAVLEQASVTIALKRAASLSRGTRWRILVLFLLGLVLGWVASLVIMVPLFVVVALVPGLNSPEHAQAVGTIAAAGVYGAWFVVQALTMPIYAIALVLFYYDQRVRREGFDIELLMQKAGMLDGAPVVPQEIPAPNQTSPDSLEANLPEAESAPMEHVSIEASPADPA